MLTTQLSVPVARIYKITNKKNGKAYIGFTKKTVSKRWYGHKAMAKADNRNSWTEMYRDMKKIVANGGTIDENFEVVELYTSTDIDHTFKVMEQHFIDIHGTMAPCGYNALPGGKHHLRKPKQEKIICA